MRYSGLLCNIAEGRLAVGENSQAADDIAAAIAALTPHENNPRCTPYMAR